VDEASELQHLLLEAYRHIGEPDSLYGVGFSFTNSSSSKSSGVGSHSTRLSLYEHEGDWLRALSG